ncbi:MAG TPA: hypothetical protein VEF90_10570 [Xanthobacteraceae bacterium]|nr:hypothetical protein [Xanthobacteraceae bacterium]
MSDRTNIGVKSRWSVFTTTEARYVAIVACVVTIVGILVGGHLYGRYLASLDLGGRDNAIEQLRAESQAQKRKIDEQSAQLTAMQVKLNNVQSQLESIMPSANTYNINPNQTLIVGDGRLAIGMIGSPSNDSVMLAINGKQQAAIAGEVINVAADPSTSCRVTLQSFDVFKAVIVASCGGAKPQ